MKHVWYILLNSLVLYSCSKAICEQKIPMSEAPNDRFNYPSNFQVERGANLFIFGDYLYWKTNEDGLYFAQMGSNDASSNSSLEGKIRRIDPQWQDGMRIGVGINFPKEGYDTVFYWTSFSTNGYESTHSDEKTTIPLWAEPNFPTFIDTIQAIGKWDLDLNTLDLEWGRSSWFGGHLSIRPFFGLRAAYIQQNLKIHFKYATVAPDSLLQYSRSNLHAGGLRAGLNTRFTLPYGFAIYGIASGSMLYGEFNANYKAKENQSTIARAKDKFRKGVSSMQLGLGMGWDTHLAQDRLHIEFHIGWEQNMWFSVNQMNHYLNQLDTGFYFKENSNLSTQGLVAGGRFDF